MSNWRGIRRENRCESYVSLFDESLSRNSRDPMMTPSSSNWLTSSSRTLSSTRRSKICDTVRRSDFAMKSTASLKSSCIRSEARAERQRLSECGLARVFLIISQGFDGSTVSTVYAGRRGKGLSEAM